MHKAIIYCDRLLIPLKGGILMGGAFWVAKMAAKIAKILYKLSNISFFQFLISYFGPEETTEPESERD